MSDFLHRAAAKAIGSDARLMPRLPSLFEPLARAPVMPGVAEADGEERVGATHDTAAVEPMARSLRAAQIAEAELSPRQTFAPLQAKDSAQKRGPFLELEEAQPGSVNANSASPLAVAPHPLEPRPTPRPAEVEPPQREGMRPRRASMLLEPPAPPRWAGPEQAALLVPSSPIFAALRSVAELQEHPARPNAAHPRGALADSASAATAEPIVHVSIGRIEVRAAPTAAPTPRHRNEPQPSSLDDYLRQRGGKGKP